MNIHEERVLNKLTDRGPGWTIVALCILRARNASMLAKIAVPSLAAAVTGIVAKVTGLW